MAKIVQCEISEILLPVFPTKIFMVLQLIFKSFIHFEFILLCGINWGPNLFACVSPVLPTPFIGETAFTPLYAHALFVKY